jgi:3-oxoacyl-[acyl-carrier protein] reductase
MDLGISGKRAAVAGASSGLGLASARALAAEGVRVVIGSRSAEKLEAAAASIDGDVVAVVGDVSTPEGATAWAEAAAAELGGVDILVPNAGGPPPGTFASTPLDAYPGALDLNLLSTVAMCKALVPAMQEAGWGRVVAITSVSVRQPIGSLILSNTARAGVTGFLKTLALEVAGDGVTVNSAQPGTHDTDRIRSLYGGDTAGAARGIPVGFVGDPDDFGAAVAFLCSEQARFITGHGLPVDGGAVRGLL